MLNALDKSTVDIKDPQRLRDLAHLSLARIYYSGAIRLNPETNVPTVGEEPLNVAFKYWNQVSQDGEYWLEAQYEQAWAFFMAGDYSGALGTVHTIRSPFIDEWQYPEVDILESVIYYANCNYEAAMINTARFNRRFVPMKADLEKLLLKYKKRPPEAWLELLMQLRVHKTQLASELAGSVWRDRALLRNYEYVQAIDGEQRRLARLPSTLRDSNLGQRVRTELIDARHRFVVAMVNRAISYFDDFTGRIYALVRDGERMFVSNLMSANSRRGGSPPRMDALAPNGVVTTDDDHIRWPFDGEYWRDELGTYRQTIINTCGRSLHGLRNLL